MRNVRLAAALVLSAGGTAVVLATATAAPAAGSAVQAAVFKVSFTGIQRYEKTVSSQENPASTCFDQQARGIESGSSVMRFGSRRAAVLTVTRPPYGLPVFDYRGHGDIYSMAVQATDTLSGSTTMEVSSCVGGSREWRAAPPVPHACGSKELAHMGADLRPESATQLVFYGGADVPRKSDPFAACLYGEHQYGLYQASTRFSAQELFDRSFGKLLFVLRATSRTPTFFNGRGGIGRTVVTTRTTVYVTLVRVH